MRDRLAEVRAAVQAAQPRPDAFPAGSELAAEELAFLHALGRDVVTGSGAVVELGAAPGGSTYALARGLLDGGTGARLQTYDDFAAEGARERWDAATADVRDAIDLHPGRIGGTPANGGIEVLFVDLVDSAETMAAVMRGFVSRLRPGSVLVHQDLFHWSAPWVAITVEALWDHLDLAGHVARSSGVFVVRDSLAEAARALDWDRLSTTAGLVLVDRLAARFEHPSLRGSLELAALHLAAADGGQLFERRREALAGRLTGPRLERFLKAVTDRAAA